MNVEFLHKLGIDDTAPNVVLGKLEKKEVDLLVQKSGAELNGEEARVKETEDTLEKLRAEKEIVREEAKSYVPKKKELPEKTIAKAQEKSSKAAYENFIKQKKADAKAAQKKAAAASSKGDGSKADGSKKDAQPAAQTGTVSGQKPENKNVNNSLPNTSNEGSDYSKGLKCYQKQDYKNASQYFFNVAENRDAKALKDPMVKREVADASYLLAMMYSDGTGEIFNKGADVNSLHKHYLKRAAELGLPKAQMDYGLLVLNTNRSQTAKSKSTRKEGWAFLEMAADAGLVEARKAYIDTIRTSPEEERHRVAKAKKYISLIKDQLDSYDIRKCEEWLGNVKIIEKPGSSSKKYVIGEIMSFIGVFCLCYEIAAIQGMILIVVGNFIRSLGVQKVDFSIKKYKVFRNFVRCMLGCLCFACCLVGGENGIISSVVALGCIVIGRVCGGIAHKIIK